MRNMINLLLTLTLLLSLIVSLSTYAAIEIYEFSDPQLSARFQKLTHELRCPKCQNQNLAGSNSKLSVDLKDIVYEKLNTGETDQQILDFMKQRYGEFILFKPEMKQDNLFLWFGPLAFLLGFMFLFYRWYANNRQLPEVLADGSDLSTSDKQEESDIK
jgi:cytochrome c-type biogenesis protein CcmH